MTGGLPGCLQADRPRAVFSAQMSMEGAKGRLSRAGRSPELGRQGTVF